ncbi:MFS general substrate transporter [Mycena crocata]|nr:MFS general substrate transporter [Mycena crocata]
MTGGFGLSLGSSSPSNARWKGTARVLGPTWTHLPTLTIGLLGVQIFWSVEMSYASPYLLSLGLSTSHVALVFLAGPLSGLLVQPLVGALADTNTSRWGRRRPYILGGCIICVCGMLLLGYTRAVAGVFTTHGSVAHNVLTVVLAVLSIFIIDFSINAVQAVDRALLVDTLPPSKQAAGNASAAVMLGFGSVVGFFIGNLPLTTLLPFLHAESELQALSVLVSIVLLASHGLTAALVRERVLLENVGAPRLSLAHELRVIWTNARTLPRVIRQICVIQFFAWLGWFPVLFYTTMYISDVYLRETDASNVATAASLLAANAANSTARAIPPAMRLLARAAPHLFARTSARATPPAVADIDVDAPTRLGARAQLLSALLALAANVLLPFVLPTPDGKDSEKERARRRGLRNSRLMGRVELPRLDLEGGGAGGVGMRGGMSPGGISPGGISPGGLMLGMPPKEPWWRRVRVPDAVRVPLPTLWAASHAVFAACMVGSFFTHSVAGATLLITFTGFSWGITQWAPFSLLAEAILTAPAPTGETVSMSIRLADARTPVRAEEEEGFLVSRPGEESESDDDDDVEEVRLADTLRDESRGAVGSNPRAIRENEGGGDEGEDEYVRAGYGDDDDDASPVGKGSKLSLNEQRRALLGNPHAQLSVVDVLTPLSTYAPRFGAGGERGGDGFGERDGEGDADAEGDVEGRREGEGEGGLSAKAGVILGIHNIFIVIPQFLVTGLSAVIFAIFDGPPPVHPSTTPGTPAVPVNATIAAGNATIAAVAEGTEVGRNSVVVVFRIGGIWACIAFVLAWRLAREMRRR